MKGVLRIVVLTTLLVVTHTVGAEPNDSGVSFSGSGFLTLAAGNIFKGGKSENFNQYHSPIYVVDYAQAGIYEDKEWSIKPGSKIGWQETATFSPEVSITGQLVSRASRNGKVDLEWLYANLGLTDNLTLQIGRKRLPLFYYSEVQDVGFSYPWTSLPPGQYGWEIVNYNGANLLYRSQWGAWTSVLEAFAGSETRNDNPYWKVYNGRDIRTDSRWTNILGASLSLTHGDFETRLAYIRSEFQNRTADPSVSPPPFLYSPKARQQIYSVSSTATVHNWLLHGEYLYMDRAQTGAAEYSSLLGIGYRMGRYLPMLTYNRYWETLKPGRADPSVADPTTIDPLGFEGWSTLTASLRYALTATSDIKAEVGRWVDRNGPTFNGGVSYGNPWVFSVSYDLVF